MIAAMAGRYDIAQLAYIVDDLEDAARRHSAIFGSGPFIDFGRIPLEIEHGGRSMPLGLHSAFGQWGDIQVELIRPDADADIFVGSARPAPGTIGCHHVAVFAREGDGLIETMQDQGIDRHMIVRPAGTDIRAHFMDARAALGHFIEVYEPSAIVSRIYALVRAAHHERRAEGPYIRASLAD